MNHEELVKYADLVRKVVAWVQERQGRGETTTWYQISRRYGINLDTVEDICGDSVVYGPQLMPHATAHKQPRGQTIV